MKKWSCELIETCDTKQFHTQIWTQESSREKQAFFFIFWEIGLAHYPGGLAWVCAGRRDSVLFSCFSLGEK